MNKADKDKLQQNTIKWWRKNINWLFITGIVLLVSAGRVAWAAAWVYLAAIPLTGSTQLLTGLMGLAGGLVFLVLNLLILFFGKPEELLKKELFV